MPKVSRCATEAPHADLGRRLFAFAVVADSHLEPEPAGLAWPRSNARNRSVVDWLAPMRPRFVLHLGDIVHPVPEAPGHDSTLELAERLFGRLQVPVLYTPGNHDIGDKQDDTAPAKAVTEGWLAEYARVFGAPYQAVAFDGILVVLLNSPILGSGLAVEAAQRRWLERTLAQSRGRRVFIATHYPPFLSHPGEAASYDNMEPAARSWFLDLLRRHRVEAVFCGHVHNSFYNRLDGTEIYALPSTAFARRDYSELHRAAPTPADEFGRNDTGKLGFHWVDVHEHGHVARLVETAGSTSDLDAWLPGHPKDPGETPLGLNLRHPWCEWVELPCNPPVDEFARRVVRNDHPVQALWSMGVRSLRAPVGDLLDDRVRARVAEMTALGMRFTFHSVGLPEPELLDALQRHARLVSRWECVLPARAADELARRAGPLVRDHGIHLLLANLRSGTAGNTRKEPGKHYTAPGFACDEIEVARSLLQGPLAGVADGLCFGIPRGEAAEPQLLALSRLAESTGATIVATRSLMGDGPNDAEMDDERNLAFVKETLVLARRHPRVELLLDTFMDIDRGYFARQGLVDRRCNWRPAGSALARTRAAQVSSMNPQP
jgi:UDP-2,3-diacylglucosamine pyrophosphatase LpxH